MKKNRLLVSALLLALSLVKNVQSMDSTAAAGGEQSIKKSPPKSLALRRLQADATNTNRFHQETAPLAAVPLRVPIAAVPSGAEKKSRPITRQVQVRPAACMYLDYDPEDDETPLEDELFNLPIEDGYQPEPTSMAEVDDLATAASQPRSSSSPSRHTRAPVSASVWPDDSSAPRDTFSHAESSSSPFRYQETPVSASAWPDDSPVLRDIFSRARSGQKELELFGPDDAEDRRMAMPSPFSTAASAASRASSSSKNENNKTTKARFKQQFTHCINSLRDTALIYQENKEQRALSVNTILAGYLNEISAETNYLKMHMNIRADKKILRLGQLKNYENFAEIMTNQICSIEDDAEYEKNIAALYNAFREKTLSPNSVTTFLKGLRS